MRLVQLVLVLVVVLLANVNAATATNEVATSIAAESDDRRRELAESSTDLEERAKRSGGGGTTIHRTGTHTSIGLMYPNDTPYLKKLMLRFRAWLKRVFGKKETTRRYLR
ncbi:hypothetical protein V7S43_015816 [Phytophthora oleae]|uniref:RxLR effector protein n=1 Tax=Phytophthora oleae TaxID=2107226 RepID=A0ABD3EXN1_9STRA